MYFFRTEDGTVFLVTDNGMAPITQPSHYVLFQRIFNSYPGVDTFNAAERDIVRSYIHAASSADDAETARILAALAALPKPSVDPAPIVAAVKEAIAAQGVEVDFAPVLAAIESVNANIDDQPVEFEITPKE